MRTFLIELKDGSENEISARSICDAAEIAERDHGRKNVVRISETTQTSGEAQPISVEELHVIGLSSLANQMKARIRA